MLYDALSLIRLSTIYSKDHNNIVHLIIYQKHVIFIQVKSFQILKLFMLFSIIL